ncbi:hypothetical protein GCM10028805_14110 [Spirosoma harenae]
MQPNLSHLFDTTSGWLDAFFVITTLITIGLLYMAIRQVSAVGANRWLVVSLSWSAILALLADQQFFFSFDTRPPRFVFVIGLPILLIIGLLVTQKGRSWISQLPLSTLTFLHTVRIPVELTLYWLYVHHQIPELMTFAGRNYDILAGLTAPVIAYFVFQRGQLSTRWLLVWNLISLGLVLNIVTIAILSAPFPFQEFGFEQPNVGVLKIPYIWLPGVIVPAVLFAHAIAILRLLKTGIR